MTDPILLDSVSPRFGLPFLHAGQAQKEVFVNEAHALADALLHCAIEGEATDPPVSPEDGTNWMVSEPAAGDWIGQEGKIACRQAGNWLFVTPRDGMRILDLSTGQDRRHAGSWRVPSTPPEPIGGSTVDAEAREAILALTAVLREAGILPDA